jgi:hypothetical protein
MVCWREIEEDLAARVIPLPESAPTFEDVQDAVPAVAARIAALEERTARAERTLLRLGLRRCPGCGLWLAHQALAPAAGCGADHEELLRQEAG